VREVIGVDIVPELVEEGRKRAPANVELVGDSVALPHVRFRQRAAGQVLGCRRLDEREPRVELDEVDHAPVRLWPTRTPVSRSGWTTCLAPTRSEADQAAGDGDERLVDLVLCLRRPPGSPHSGGTVPVRLP
jgi:hypothetical protein